MFLTDTNKKALINSHSNMIDGLENVYKIIDLQLSSLYKRKKNRSKGTAFLWSFFYVFWKRTPCLIG